MDDATIHVDLDAGIALIPPKKLDFPPVCAVCLQDTQASVEITGGKSPTVDLALAMVHVAYYTSFYVGLCPECQHREEVRRIQAYALGAAGMTLGGMMVALSSFESAVGKLGGMLVLIGSPFAARARRRPAIRTFDKQFVTLRFPNRDYLPLYVAYLKFREWPHEVVKRGF